MACLLLRAVCCAATLAQPPARPLHTQMTREAAAAASGRHLEKLLGAGWTGKGQVLSCTRLRVLALGRNGLKGSVPPALILCPSLSRLELHENHLDGKLPDELTASLTELRVLRLQGNQLTGELPSRCVSPPVKLCMGAVVAGGELPSRCRRAHCLRRQSTSSEPHTV